MNKISADHYAASIWRSALAGGLSYELAIMFNRSDPFLLRISTIFYKSSKIKSAMSFTVYRFDLTNFEWLEIPCLFIRTTSPWQLQDFVYRRCQISRGWTSKVAISCNDTLAHTLTKQFHHNFQSCKHQSHGSSNKTQFNFNAGQSSTPDVLRFNNSLTFNVI